VTVDNRQGRSRTYETPQGMDYKTRLTEDAIARKRKHGFDELGECEAHGVTMHRVVPARRKSSDGLMYTGYQKRCKECLRIKEHERYLRQVQDASAPCPSCFLVGPCDCE
jgi:hypothetical protein